MAEVALASAYVTIVPSFDGFRKSVDRDLPNTMAGAGEKSGKAFGSKFSSGFRGLVGPALAAFSVASVTRFLGDSVSLASDLAEQGAAVGQVFGAGATQVQKFAQGAATSLGQSTTQVLEAAKSFGIYGKAAGLAGTANANFSTDFVKLATDLASFNNTSVDDALLALQSGLRGEAEPLRRYGILLDDATLRQEALKLGLIKTVKEALTPAQKVLAAQAAIYSQSATQQGDFARTSSGLANQQRILAAEIENAKISIGEQLLPVMKDLVTNLATNVLPAISRFIQAFKDGKTALNPIVDVLKNVIKFVIEYKDVLIPLVVSIFAFIKVMGLLKIIIEAVRTATLLFNLVLAANPITLIVLAIMALIAALVLFFTKTEAGRKVFAALKDAFSTAFNFMKRVAEDFANFWITIINGIIEAVNLLLKALKFVTFGSVDIQLKKIPKINLTGSGTNTPQTATPKATTQAGQTNAALGAVTGSTFIYNAAPNNSLDAKTELVTAVNKARTKGVGN